MLKKRANFDEDIGADRTFEDVGISLRTFLLSQVSVEVWAITELALTEPADPTKFVREVFVQNKFSRGVSKKPRLMFRGRSGSASLSSDTKALMCCMFHPEERAVIPS